MTKDLLIEIGLEEVPARFVSDAVNQLADKLTKWLQQSRVEFGDVNVYGTPRRLTVHIHEVADKGSDMSEQMKGPSRKIAKDDSDNWSKAALGFARSQGVEPEDLYFQELQGVEYVYATKNTLGIDTAQSLSEALEGMITSMTFPKNMRWGANELKFVRPIRWLVALFGTEVIPFAITGVEAGRTTRGHRFLGTEVEIADASSYVETLRSQYVLVNSEERREIIIKGIQAISKENGWVVPMQEDLLEEVVYLVEYPTPLVGTFSPDFLEIPQEVLITSMREHQRYFPVLDEAGNLKPNFITVRNGDSRSLETVAKGNEKVLRARLSDAKFFYAEDQKVTIASRLERLENIVFQEELGTIGDKVRRIVKIADSLATLIQVDESVRSNIRRAAEICKFDLVSQMVYEFPELQGIMGEDYARIAGEKEEVAVAINEHYKPRFSGDSSPASIVGTLVSIADKIDTISGCFSIGIIPTGSQDPYGLRRQAAGIVQMTLDHKLPVSLTQIFGAAIDVLQDSNLVKRDALEIKSDMQDFFGLRVKNVLTEKGIRYDVIDAIMGAGIDNLSAAVRKADVLGTAVQEAAFKTTVESFNRVGNLASKADSAATVQADLLQEQAEQDLFAAWQSARPAFTGYLADEQEAKALVVLTDMKDVITTFFDSVMVMAEDENVRRNRLALLHGIAADLRQFADFSKLVWQ
ncbi:glycine--tRNA ligase subunit beta [Paenibacillus sp. N1-5-1-14]|uniref:glycine--tRNA ligase subunit beta n=1 Tax=Paenibacillus radicibacter TaxID=2972488 RepID=UPI002158FBB5|nr:glycine--tRNA ligase subunit beta [Paenibacillus radicibacter]MCR8641967.1 glycine--tRNA ligase subunit beta [Paenibacillus radicibacter]